MIDLNKHELLKRGLKKCIWHPKYCPNENEILPVSEFNKDKKMFSGLSPRCRVCQALARNKNLTNATEIRDSQAHIQEQNSLIKQGKRQCGKCKKVKPLKDFYKVRNRDHYFSHCKSCSIDRRNNWATSPTDRIKRRLSGRKIRDKDPIRQWARKSLESHRKRFKVTLTLDELCEYASNNTTCYYCKYNLYAGYNQSIDVLDSKKPVTISNVVLCCKPCNFTKSTKSACEYKEILQTHFGYLDDIYNRNEILIKPYFAKHIPIDILKQEAARWE